MVEADGHGEAEAVAVVSRWCWSSRLAVGAAVVVAVWCRPRRLVQPSCRRWPWGPPCWWCPCPSRHRRAVPAVLVGMAVLVAPTLGVAVAAGLVVVVPTVDDVAGEDERQALATFAVLIAVPECEG